MLCWWIGTDANVANERSTTWKWTLAANVHTRLSLTSSTKWIWLKDKLSYLSECLLSCKPDRPIVSFFCKRVKEYNDVFIVEEFVKSCVGAVNWTRTTKMRLSLLSLPPPQKKQNKTKQKQKKPANSDQFIPRCKTKYLLLAPKEVDQGPLIHDDIPRFFCPVLRLKETKIIQNLFLFRKILT